MATLAARDRHGNSLAPLAGAQRRPPPHYLPPRQLLTSAPALRDACHHRPPQLPWNLVGHNAGGCKIKWPSPLTVSRNRFALLIYCYVNWNSALMCIKFQNSVWVCIEIKNVRKKGRKEGRDEVTVNGSGQLLFPASKCALAQCWILPKVSFLFQQSILT